MKKLKRFVITDADCFIKGTQSDDPHVIPLNDLNFERLQDFTESNQFPVMREIVLEDGSIALKPARYAGIITLKDGTQIELMPQICLDRDENAVESKKTLLYMLDSMVEIPVRHVDELYFKKEQLNIFEICVRMFTDEVLNVVRNGLKQTYVPYRGNEMFVKGKTIYSEHAKKNFAHKEKFFVEYDVFSINRAENRLLKTTLSKLYKLSTNTLNKKRISMLLTSLDGVDFSPNIFRDFKASVEDRSMSKYFNAMKWCRLFLLNRGTTTFFAGGKVAYAMLFPIDKLFCGCFASSLRRQLNREKYYFMTPEKVTNSLSNTSLDLNMEPVSNFYIKSKIDGSVINIIFKFNDFTTYRGRDDDDSVVIFPVTEVLNRKVDGIKKNMYLIDLADIDGSVSVLTETYFV
ncbi:MAG: hypothetical protein ACI4JF_01235 [Oscillospiraceae bacterium]